MRPIVEQFIKENNFKKDSSGLYLIGRGDLNRLIDEYIDHIAISILKEE